MVDRGGANPYRNGNLLHSETKPRISAAGSRFRDSKLTADTVVLNCSVLVDQPKIRNNPGAHPEFRLQISEA